MYPMYAYVEDFSLNKDDIEGIQYLYGKVNRLFTKAKQKHQKYFNLNFSQPSLLFLGPKIGPDPTPPQPTTPTTPYPDPDETDPTDEPEPTKPVDPTKDACKLDKFDSITVTEGELHFFKDG